MSFISSEKASALGFDPDRLAKLDAHFAQYVDDGRLVGWQLAITRHDEVAHLASYGLQDREADRPVSDDTIWRIASMTKPLTSVAAMSFWEEGRFHLNDPISTWIPAFADMRVWVSGSGDDMLTVPATEPIRVWHVLSHTAGLTVGFMMANPVDALYRDLAPSLVTATLEQTCDAWAQLPLLFEPGTRWGYGVSTDVLGRLVEIWAGKPLDEVFRDRITEPLGMNDTVWYADETRLSRLTGLYAPSPVDGKAVRFDGLDALALNKPIAHSGGGGLLSTTDDFVRFTRMLARGGELDGVRILSPRTLDLMTSNVLPADMESLSTGGFSETQFAGMGFGLGFAVLLDPVLSRTTSSAGEYNWGGAASTVFWVDPAEALTVVFMTSLIPSTTYPIRPELRQLVYSALVS